MNNIENVIVLGDFNLNFIDWNCNSDCNYLTPSNYNNNLGHDLVDFLSINNIHQYNHIKNSNGKTLDLVLSNCSNLEICQPLDLLSKLDAQHPHLNVSVTESYNVIAPNLLLEPRETYNFYKADYESLNEVLSSADWHAIFKDCKNEKRILN